MRSFGFEPRREEIQTLTAKIMKNEAKRKTHPDCISFDELFELLSDKMGERNTVTELKAAFDLFDADSKGYISVKDLHRVAEELGDDISDEQLQEMISEADSKGTGSISEEDFCTIMKKTCLY
uniref:EF-hand domain-containing protein n=1 Tax=Syphacia muris TaxID=451379 RepID=A0A0N5ASC0_9BILA